MGKTDFVCPTCSASRAVLWCDNCGARLGYVAVELSHGYGHYRDGDYYHFCSDECKTAWESDPVQQAKHPSRPANWAWAEGAGPGVALKCERCAFEIGSRDLVKLRQEDYGLSDMCGPGGSSVCPKCGSGALRAVHDPHTPNDTGDADHD